MTVFVLPCREWREVMVSSDIAANDARNKPLWPKLVPV
jgi:hypothetical protein